MTEGSLRGSFLLDLDESQSPESRTFSGRIEHILSGETTLFTNVEAIAEFVRVVLAAEPTAGRSVRTESGGDGL